MAVHRVLSTNIDPDAPEIIIGGDEAHHAIRVKRLQAGDPIEILNGAGILISGEISAITKQKSGEWVMAISVQKRNCVPALNPRLELWTATPKGTRLDEMIEGLSEVGAAAWHPLSTIRGVVDPRENKLHRLERIALESSKQCGRAWKLEIGDGGDLAHAFALSGTIIVSDASGAPYEPSEAMGAATIHVLVGPEGGWTPEELAQCRAANVRICRFGPHIMRIETAAVAAAAVILARSH